MNTALTGRSALIIGGSRGIGAACARTLARFGAHAVITYRSDSGAAQETVDDITAAGGSAESRCLDIAVADQVAALVADLDGSGPPIDILVANAAANYPKVPLLQLKARELAGKIAADIGAAHILTTALAPPMQRRGYGRLIYLSGGHAEGPTAPGMTANGTSKAALEAYVKFVVDELTGDGITANVVRPGLVATDASRRHLPPAVLDALTAATPAKRVASPADIADVVGFLAVSGDMVNGAAIPVTGGLNAPVSLQRLSGETER